MQRKKEVVEVIDEVLAMKMQLENYLEEARAEALLIQQRTRSDVADPRTEATRSDVCTR